MSAKVTCPACNRSYAFKPQLAGKRVKCKCGGSFEFPLMAPVADADAHATPEVLTAADAIDPPPAPPFPVASLPGPYPPAPATHKSNLLPILIVTGAVCLVLGILGVGAVLFFFGSDLFGTHKAPAPVGIQRGAGNVPSPTAPPPFVIPPPPAGNTVLQSGDALLYPIQNTRLVRVSVHQNGPVAGPFLLTTLTEAQHAAIQFPIDPSGNPLPQFRLRIMTTRMDSFTTNLQPDIAYIAIINMSGEPMNITYDITPMQ